jgi:NAD(P)-dependent dehydrogenase (short-subunit alcohol dehydrogenase family)
MADRLAGKRVLMVGCGQGFGATTARQLAAEGDQRHCRPAGVLLAKPSSHQAGSRPRIVRTYAPEMESI